MKTYCTIKDLESSQDELTAWRRAIHQQPELAFKETATARMVADKLTAWGYAVTEGVGTTGVVGTLKAGSGTRSIGLRADMDALPIAEQTGLPYASRNEGVMHACGHDGHTTMLLGAAQHLAAHAEFLGHRPADLPAGRGERDRLRREADAGRRALRALSVRRHLRHAQPSRQAGAHVPLSQRARSCRRPTA